MTINPQNIPAELRARRQWVCWKLEHPEGRDKPTKVPYTVTGGHGSTTNPAKWATLEDCLAAVEEHGFSGVGFVFTKEDPYVGVDLDGIPWAQAEPMVRGLLPAYVEISQSGKGIHVIMKGSLPPGARRKGPVEAYTDGRYFAITANVVGEPVPVLEDRTSALAAFHATYLGGFLSPDQPSASGAPPGKADYSLTVEDQAVLDTIQASKHARQFFTLYDAGEHNPNKRSEADFDLAKVLCTYTLDTDQVIRIMANSALARDKWREMRGPNTLLRHTVLSARKKTAFEQTRSAAEEKAAQEAIAPATFIPFSTLHKNPPPETGWLIDQVWPATARGWIAGEAKLGKSWVALEMALALATGSPLFGEYHIVVPDTRKLNVLYLTEESNEWSLYKRLRMLLLGRNIPPGDVEDNFRLLVRQGVKLSDHRWVDKLKKGLDEYDADIVFIDPLRRYHNANENQAEEMTPVLDNIASLQIRPDKSLRSMVVIHHSRKTGMADTETRAGQTMRGTSDFHAWGDAAFYCTGNREQPGQVEIEVELKDEAPPEGGKITVTIDYAKEPVRAEVVGREAIMLRPTTLRSEAGTLKEAKERTISERILELLIKENRTLSQTQIWAMLEADKTSKPRLTVDILKKGSGAAALRLLKNEKKADTKAGDKRSILWWAVGLGIEEQNELGQPVDDGDLPTGTTTELAEGEGATVL